jgi:hypothetical protein
VNSAGASVPSALISSISNPSTVILVTFLLATVCDGINNEGLAEYPLTPSP